jgi:hypothetical protein
MMFIYAFLTTYIYFGTSLNATQGIPFAMQTPRHVNKLLSASSDNLHRLVDHCSQLQRVTRLVCEFLPSPLNQHCQVANIRDKQLILHADSSVWASMLHYRTPALLEFLNQQPGLEHISNIRTRTLPHNPESSDNNPSPARLTRTTASLIGNLADSMSNPALKKALLRLARHSTGSAGE